MTGGAGYLGAVLVPMLLARGHEVVVLDCFLYGQTPLLDQVHDPRLEIVRGDARDERLLQEVVPRCDVLVPLACLTGAPSCQRDPEGARGVIVDALATLLRLRSPGQPVLLPTSQSVYGSGPEGGCDETSPVRPLSLYGRLKAEAESRLLDAGGGVSLRLATLFGASPRMRLDLLVHDFVWRALHDRVLVLFEGHYRRNLVHVRDAARAFLQVAEDASRFRDGVYNVGRDDTNPSKAELCRAIQDVVPGVVVLEASVGSDPDQRNYVVTSARFAATGWEPRHGLEEGLRELVRSFAILPRRPFSNA